MSRPANSPAWLASVGSWLTLRRVRTHAIILAFCLWSVCAVDFLTLGIVDRGGNIKFQDFLPLYVSARMIANGRASQIYDPRACALEISNIIEAPVRVSLPYLYGPQVALLLVPLTRFPFLTAAAIWAALSVLIYCVCVYLLLNAAPGLAPYRQTVWWCAVAFPPLFHLFVRGQNSAIVLACFTAAYLFLLRRRAGLAGIALGLLIFKPQFLVAIPFVLLLAGAWKILAGLALSAVAQLTLAWAWFGSAIMRSYLDALRSMSGVGLSSTGAPATAELSLAPIQMHSLRSFWTLLIPFPPIALALYVLSVAATIIIAAAVWKSSSPVPIRFAALTLAVVLADPHLFIYDLVVLAPAFLLLAALLGRNDAPALALRAFIYFAALLPLFGPLSRWTHLQLSVPVFFALLWFLWRCPLPEEPNPA